MKVLGGRLKGRNFYMPQGIRPTQNLVRKAVFDILKDVRGSVFLDIFAGSGAVGLEACSRGAQRVVFIEKDPSCIQVIRENFELLGLEAPLKAGPQGPGGAVSSQDPIQLIPGDAFAFLKKSAGRAEKFDIIFFDPPYGRGLGKKTLKTLAAHDIVQPNSLIIVQTTATETLPKREGRFFLVREKRYGASVLAIYRVMSYEPSRHLSREL